MFHDVLFLNNGSVVSKLTEIQLFYCNEAKGQLPKAYGFFNPSFLETLQLLLFGLHISSATDFPLSQNGCNTPALSQQRTFDEKTDALGTNGNSL